jgi:hypothetical protein
MSSISARHVTFLAAALMIGLAGCAPVAPEPHDPIGCAVSTDDGETSVALDVPEGFAPSEDDPCTWIDGDSYLSLISTADEDIVDIDDRRAESESWIGIGGDEEVSDFSFEEGVDLFASQEGDLLAYRSASDGVPIIAIVGQSADFQLSYSASADDTDVATELTRFLVIAKTVASE